MGPGANGLAAIVQKKCKIQHQRVLELLKNITVSYQFGVSDVGERVEFVDAYQCMLVGCVTVQKLMLHEAGKLTEFWNVAAEKIDPVHHPQNAPDSAFLSQNRSEDFAWPTCILISACDVAQT